MILRLSQKLNVKIKAGRLGDCPIGENPFADWSSHLFMADRTQYIIISNTKSLYSVVMFGKGITHDGQFISRALDNLREFMEGDGQAFAYHHFVAPTTAKVRFAKSLNRSVTGAMNDLIAHAKLWLTEGELSPYDVGFKLNEMPFSSLSAPDRTSYGMPREAFKSMLGRT